MTIAMPRLRRTSAAEQGITIADFLVPVRLADRLGVRARHIALIAAGALLIFLSSRVAFQFPGNPVPFTGQTFGVLLAGGALGFRRGTASAGLYLLLGLVGLPVYAEGKAGVEIILGATGGYLVGFVLAAAIVGRLAELGWDRSVVGAIVAMLVGNAVIYAIGLPWLQVTTSQPWSWVIENGFGLFVLGDAMKIALAAALFPAAWWLVGHRPGER